MYLHIKFVVARLIFVTLTLHCCLTFISTCVVKAVRFKAEIYH